MQAIFWRKKRVTSAVEGMIGCQMKKKVLMAMDVRCKSVAFV